MSQMPGPAQSLNRAQDTPVGTFKLAEITPKDWHKYPPPIAPSEKVYQPVYTWNGGVYGDDQILAKSNVLVDDRGIGDYTPRNQDDKAIALGIPIVTDVTSPRGTVSPREPYPHAGSPAEPAPTISSLTPNTAVAGDPSPLSVVVTGTNFTPYTVLIVGNVQTPYVQYASPTKMVLLMDPARSTPGIITVQAWDHSVGSAPVDFTYTAAL
jgi:hypothetical protein